VFYTGILFSFWRAAKQGKLESGPLVTKLRTHWWPLVGLVAVGALIVLGLVISKAYDHSRWPMRAQGTSKATWIGLIPVVSVFAASSLALLLFVPQSTGQAAGGDVGTDASGPEQPGDPCVRCGEATTWKREAQRFRCGSCRVYQPVGPKAV
jgi:uncharacterized membrane protein